MKALFVLEIVALAVFALTLFVKKSFKFMALTKNASAVACVLLGLVVFLIGGALSEIAVAVSIGCVLVYLLYLFSISKDAREGLKNTALFAAKALLVILILEALVFNFNCFHVWSSQYEEYSMPISSAQVTNLSQAQEKYVSTDPAADCTIEYLDINKDVGTIYLDVNSTAKKISYSIDFADESNSSYYMRSGLVKGEIIPSIEESKYIICNFSGDVSKLRITLTGDGESAISLSDNVAMNLDYPSNFSFLRVLTFLMFAVFVYLFIKSVAMNKSVKSQEKTFKAVTTVIVFFFVLLLLFMTIVESSDYAGSVFKQTTGNQMTKELVDAFKAGRVTLDTVPTHNLLALENPYDWSQRVESGASSLWDHVLYEGEYYSYYGIGPVLLLFLPYNLLTGYYFPSSLATFLFSAVGIIFLALTFKKLTKRYFSDIPLSMYIVSLVMLLTSCGIWYCIIPSNFYEIAQTSGFCFVTLGAYFLVSANVLSKGKINLLNLALSSLFLSIAVTCRPTTAVWCIVALLFIGVGIVKINREKKASGTAPVSYAKYLLCAMLPFVVIGAGQMIYNYIRFDSFTDFGIQYSLTINDFLSAQYHTQFAVIGFYNYLIAPPSFSSEFPFVMTNITDLDVNGYYFTATNNGCGMFFRALPMFALFLFPSALKHIKKENRGIITVLFLAVAVVAPFTVIYSIWESGYGVRYMIDFAWQMLMCAILIIFMLYRHTNHEETKRIYRYAMLISMILCVIVSFALTYSYIYPTNLPASAVTMFEKIARAFCVFNT